jgi:hypothetical protein
VANNIPPTISNTTVTVRAIRGQAFPSYDFAATPQPDRFQATGLEPVGLTLNTTTGRLSGVPGAEGTFKVFVVAINGFGVSAPFELTIIVGAPGELLVESLTGRGKITVSPKRPGNIYEADVDQVTLTAKPALPNFLFSHWDFSGRNDAVTRATTPTVSFTMSRLVQATANFVSNPFPGFADSYGGRVSAATPSLAGTGTLSLSINKLGAFTGSLRMGAQSSNVKGRFAPDGTAQISINRPKLEAMVLTLTLDLSAGGTERVTGTLAVDGASLAVVLDRAVFDAKNPAATYAGSYTLILPRDPTKPADQFPQGHGFGAVTVTEMGKVRFAGVLGDDTPLVQGAVLSKTGGWPFHALLYGQRGIISGDLAFDPQTGGRPTLGGALDWIKPAIIGKKVTYPGGFTLAVTTRGLAYNKAAPLAFSHGMVKIGEGNIGAIVEVGVDIDTQGRITPNPPAEFRMRVTPATGLFRGAFADPTTGRVRTFRGVLLQDTGAGTRRGYGLFLGGPLPTPPGGLPTGYVELLAP